LEETFYATNGTFTHLTNESKVVPIYLMNSYEGEQV